MESFFTSHVNNWLPITYVFSNIRTFHNNHAYMDNYDTGADTGSDHLQICLENCTEFPDPQTCIEYCHTVQDTLDRSNTVDPLRQCTDWRCCKQKAGTNDYAYVKCMEAVQTRRPLHTHTLLNLPVGLFFTAMLFILVARIFFLSFPK